MEIKSFFENDKFEYIKNERSLSRLVKVCNV